VGHEIFRHATIPFPDGRFPPDLGATIQRTVLNGDEPAREVVHVADGSWMVGDGINDPNLPGAVVVAGLLHLAEHDTSLAQLAALQPGQIAQRDNPEDPWRISVHEWLED
jgi:hypothetical protein